MTDMETCSNCDWFITIRWPEGECHRLPPQVGALKWPIVDQDEYCAEHSKLMGRVNGGRKKA